LDVAKGNSGVEGGHDEGGSEHVGIDDPESRPLANGADPTMCRAPIQVVSVVSSKDRTF
jgi:hypothetical protein